MFSDKERFEHRRRVWMAIWIVGMLMIGMVPFLPGAHATDSGDIDCAIGVNWYQNYGTWTHDQGYMLPGASTDRTYFAFNLNSIGTGQTISDAHLHIYVSNGVTDGYLSVLELPVFDNSTYSTTSTGTELSQISVTGWTTGQWYDLSTAAIDSYVASEYSAHSGWVYIALRGNGLTGAAAFGVGGDTNAQATYISVTYSGGAPTWHPAITSTPGLTYVSGTPYSYHMTANTTVGWNTTYGINPEVASWWLPKSVSAQWKSISGNSSLTALVESQRTSLGHADLVFSRPTHTNDSAGSVGWGSAESANPWYMRIYYSGSWSSNITPYEDTSVKVDSPNQTYGSSVAIYANVNSWTGLAKFNLSTGGNAITNVAIYIYNDYHYTDNATVTISEPISDSWVESTATWANYLGFSWVYLGASMVNTVATGGYFNLTVMNGTALIPVQVVISMGTETSRARDTYQNFTIGSGIHFTTTPTTTAEENAAYSYHANASDGTITLNATNASWLTYSAGNDTLWGHAPSAPETPYVHLKVDNGSAVAWQNFTITVRDTINPTANAGADQANIGEWMQFNGSGSTDSVAVTNYTWTASGMTTGYGVTYNYAWEHSTGVKTVTLTVKDAAGNSGTDTMTVTVSSSDAHIIRPYSDWGTSTWTPVPLTPTTKWDKLREPDSGSDLDATYLTSVTGSTQSYYAVPDTYTSSGTVIENVTVWAWAKKTNASTNPTFVLGTRTNATSSIWLTSTTLTTTWTNYSATLALCPFTGNPWRTYDVSLLRLWIRSSTAAGQFILVSQVAAMIHDYDPSPVFTSSPTTAVKLNTAYSYTVTTDISSTKTLDYSDASWLTYSAGNSTLWGRSPSSLHAAYTVNLKAVSTAFGTITYQNYTLSLITWGPTFTSTPATSGTIGVQYTYNATWNETISLPITGYWLPAWATTDVNGINFWGTPIAPGIYPFILEAKSSAGGDVTWQFWNVTVPTQWGPTYTSTPTLTVYVGINYTYHVTLNESSTWISFMASGPVLPSYSVQWNLTATGAYRSMMFSTVGSYHLSYKWNSVAGTLSAYQNWTLVVSLSPHVYITSNPSLTARNGTLYTYTITTNFVATITYVDGPSWLTYTSWNHKLTGVCPSNGLFNVTFMAYHAGTDTYDNQTFSILAAPSTLPVPVSDQWLTFIPIIILFVTVMLASYRKDEGFSGLGFLGLTSIGVILLVWTETLPWWTLIIPAIIIGLIIYREVR